MRASGRQTEGGREGRRGRARGQDDKKRKKEKSAGVKGSPYLAANENAPLESSLREEIAAR